MRNLISRIGIKSRCFVGLFVGRFSVFFVATCLSACANFSPQPNKHGVVVTSASAPAPTETHKLLTDLPLPVGKIVTAVYGFRDLTGQYKPAPSNGLSTAVTQGASNLLVKSLLDSGWFRPVERNGLQNLLTERNIWDQRLNGSKLSPMPAASVILEGGLIGYDFNVRTGGAGAQYLGIGASKSYREDTVTVNLRAVNAQDGTILHSINSTKRVYSESINTGLFGFVQFDQLLEIESGYAFNEPLLRSVEEAIEAGLINLIAEGVLRDTWKLSDPQAISHPAFAKYISKDEVAEYLTNAKSNVDKNNSPNVSVQPPKKEVSDNNPTLKKDHLAKATESVKNTGASPAVEARPADVEATAASSDDKEVLVAEVSEKQDLKLREEQKYRESKSSQYLANALKEEKEYQRIIDNKRAEKRLKGEIAASQAVASKNDESPNLRKQDSITPVKKQAKSEGSSKNVQSISLLVGQYSSIEEVDAWQKKIKESVGTTKVSRAANPEKTIFKVLVGPLFHQEEIDAVIAQLRKTGVKEVQVLEND